MPLFTKKINAETSTLKDNYDALNSALGNEEPGTAAYQTILDQLKTVHEMLAKTPSWSFKPSADTILTVGATLLMSVLVIRHEQFNTMTSKVVGFLPKLIK